MRRLIPILPLFSLWPLLLPSVDTTSVPEGKNHWPSFNLDGTKGSVHPVAGEAGLKKAVKGKAEVPCTACANDRIVMGKDFRVCFQFNEMGIVGQSVEEGSNALRFGF